MKEYEEGKWEPVRGPAVSESGQTYSVREGKYIRFGPFIECSFEIKIETKPTTDPSA